MAPERLGHDRLLLWAQLLLDVLGNRRRCIAMPVIQNLVAGSERERPG
jgi:hypothetical protein